MATFASDSILPEPPPGASMILHDREYRVRAFRSADDRIVIQGAIRDQKPPGLLLPDDDAPLTIHHMQLSLTVAFPELEILEVTTHFETHPHSTCPTITEHYERLIGLSIARGFTHRVRELFGGPRGCTHTTALLQAMAPVAVQCFWSMSTIDARERGLDPSFVGSEERRDLLQSRNRNTCHVWSEDGPMFSDDASMLGEEPLFIRRRRAELERTE